MEDSGDLRGRERDAGEVELNQQIVHVLPLNDLKSHLEGSRYCHCQPRIQQLPEGTIVVHNSYDGREFYENFDDPVPEFNRNPAC